MTISEANLTGTILPFWLLYVDVLGDTVRATTLPRDIAMSGSGDSDLDGFTYQAIAASALEVSDVSHGVGGSESVTITLRALPGFDDDTLTVLATRTNWQGRAARLWIGVVDTGGNWVELYPYYTGRMVQPTLVGDPNGGQAISVTVEGYLAILSDARRRTYQDQSIYDASDLSAARIRSAGNTATGSGITSTGNSGGSRPDMPRMNVQ